MTSAKAKNIIELRQVLAEKFPGVRLAAGRPERLVERWPASVPAVDDLLLGGFAKSALTEIISSGVRCGSSLLLAQIVRQAHQQGEWIGLIDGADSFDPTSLQNEELSRLLWVRCSNPREVMKAADLLLHDGTISVIVIDLVSSERKQLRRIPSSTWHRLARTIENRSSVGIIFTPETMISTAEARLELQPRFALESLESPQELLLAQISARVAAVGSSVAEEKRFGVAG